MTNEKVAALLFTHRIPQAVLARVSGVNTQKLSLWLRSQTFLKEEDRQNLDLAMDAMIELVDQSPVPPDWRQLARLHPLLNEKIQGYRVARISDLRRQFKSGSATARQKVISISDG
jgi:hypothetical protein